MDTMQQLLRILFYALSVIAAFYFLVPVLLLLFYYLSGGRPDRNPLYLYQEQNNRDYDFAAIITVHQDGRFIEPLVDSFLKQKHNKFKVYIVADDCDCSHLTFADSRIKLLSPPQALHSKIKSIQFAIQHFERDPDVMIIFDSDNLIHPDYLKNLNRYFQRGFRVVQTHMLSKNTDKTYARLDSLGHIYYTFTERLSKMQLRMSSAILGLGVAIEYELYKEINYHKTIGGFDKKLQSQLARTVKQIGFADDAIVFDEKVEDAAVLQKQRTRWIYTYFGHFKEGWLLVLSGLRHINVGRFLLGTSMLRPPMILLALAVALIMAFSWLLNPFLLYGWLLLLTIFLFNFILIIATQSRQKGMFQSLLHVPLLLFTQLKSLLRIKKAKREFLKTEHKRVIYIDDLLANEHP